MQTRKRKAAMSKGEPAPKKRSTRTAPAPAPASSELDSSPPAKRATGKSKAAKPSPKAPKGKGKGKSEEIVRLSDSDSDDSDVIIESRKKNPTASSSKPSTKSKSRGALAAQTPIEGSTSTPAESMADAAAKKKRKPVKELPFEQALPEWFAQFTDKVDKSKMDGEGIEKLFADMGLSMDGAYPLILAWKVDAKPGTFGAFYLGDFERAFRDDKIDSSEKLKKLLVKVEKKVFASGSESKKKAPHNDNYTVGAQSPAFRQFYAFLLPFFRAEGAKTLPADAAKAMWSVVLAPRYELGKAFVEFAEEQGDNFKAVSTDLWTQLLDFCESVEPDLTGWSEDDAWPSVIDAFVEWKKEKSAST
ncbi:hypothetical protein JCM3770_003846 [Rhodotorula araucariae]